MQKYDYIIVGQGLTGTILAFKLLQLGKKVLVIDENHKNAASKVAAGIINPITGRNYVKSWKIEELTVEFLKTYAEIEAFFGKKYLIKRDVVRVLHSPKEENAWLQRTGEESYQRYLSSDIFTEQENTQLAHVGTYGRILDAYQLRISELIQDVQSNLISNELYVNEKFDFSKLNLTKIYTYKEFSFDKLVFCEGFKIMSNPFFNYLPFDPVKGEALIIKALDLKLNDNYRDQIFITPLGNHHYWIGAGYDKGYQDILPSEAEKIRLKGFLEKILLCDYETIEHKAGIRPAVKTRKPLIGRHPIYEKLFICNGMGAKGSSLVPYFANMLINFIENGQALNEEVSIIKYAEKNTG